MKIEKSHGLRSERPKAINSIDTTKLLSREVLNLLAQTCHNTWLRQREKDKGVSVAQGPEEVSNDDRKRVNAAIRAIVEGHPKTRQDVVALVAKSSLDPNPNHHDIERAEDLVKELEGAGVISYK